MSITIQPRTVGDTPKGGSILGFYAPKGTPRPPQLDRGQGIYLWDNDGKRYLDATSGAVVANIGHDNPAVVAAMQAQAAKVSFAPLGFFESRDSIELADHLCGLAGEGFDRAFFVSGGSEANDSAMKLARQYALATGQPGRHKFIARNPSYHGATLGATALTGDGQSQSLFGAIVPHVPKVPVPWTYRLPDGHSEASYAEVCAKALEETIEREGSHSVLAFILEPIGGLSTGALVSPPGYLERVREICDRHGVLLIYDEVMSGAGRTGAFLAAHHWPQARPDLVTLAKGLAAGYTPLGAVLAPNHIVDAVAGQGGFVHGHTYSTNPFSAAVANAVLGEVIRQDLVTRAREVGAVLMERLQGIARRSPIVGDVRGLGLLTAIEIVADKKSKRSFPAAFNAPKRLSENGLRRGITLYNRRANQGEFGDFQMVTPPLTISVGEIDELASLLEASLQDLTKEILDAGLSIG